MDFEGSKKRFEELKIKDWRVVGPLGKETTGQASVIEVERISDSLRGAFRFLKDPDESDIKRFKREVEILVKDEFKHTNIINILDYSIDELWYISEKGTPFNQYWKSVLEKHGDKPDYLFNLTVNIIQKLSGGLTSLHNSNVVHRDIKPANIVMVRDEPVLIDFGVVFHPNEERITDVKSAVGNARFSPDQMMNRMDNIPPWLDVFQLSQLMMWMVSEKSAKSWSRPLDWRWVIYPNDLSDRNVLTIRAISALCSEQDTAPKNAASLSKLITTFITMEDNNKNIPDDVKDILNSIQSGKSKTVISKADHIAKFTAGLPAFLIYWDQVNNHVTALFNKYSAHLPIQSELQKNINEWPKIVSEKERIEETQWLSSSQIYFRGSSQRFFVLTTHAHFYPKGEKNSEFLPDNFLPFTITLTIGSNVDEIRQPGFSLTIAIDNEGQLWNARMIQLLRSDGIRTSMPEIFDNINGCFTNKEWWELINR